MPEIVFEDFVARGRVEFCLRADAADHELPHEFPLESAGEPQALLRFARYLDQRAALHWWHRNVAKAQLGLQGWRRRCVYPDFVFGLQRDDDTGRIVLMETKGLHLAGSTDTDYKRALFERLTNAFRDERAHKSGELILEGSATEDIVCDLIFDQAWEGALEDRYFTPC